MRRIALILLSLMLATTAMAETPASGLFVVLYRQGPAWKPGVAMSGQPAIRPHGAYMKKLFDEGRSFAAGPTVDVPGGVVILRAASLEEARAIVAADPGVTSAMFTAEIHAWTPVFRSDQPLPKGP